LLNASSLDRTDYESLDLDSLGTYGEISEDEELEEIAEAEEIEEIEEATEVDFSKIIVEADEEGEDENG